MKRRWKQFLAGIMTAVMLFGLLPTAAYASIGQLIENGAVQNAALLETLRQMYGEDAEAYLAVLEQYGLVDEDGNLITNEKIVVDGVEYTLAELEAYLAQPGLDLSRIATVDGQPISLEDLQTVLEIEKYLAELKAKYFTPQDLNEDQIASFYDLAGAFANGDVVMLSSNGLTGVGPAGVDHGVRLSVEPGGSPAAGGTYTVTVTASASSVADQPISFSWRAVGGNVRVDDSESITMYPGESRTLNISVGTVDGYVDGSATFLVQLYGLKNALFSDGSTRWEKTVTVANSEPLKYTEELPFSLTSSAIQEYDYIAKKGEASIADSSSNSDEVVRNQTEVTSHLVDGNYTIKKLTIGHAEFDRNGPIRQMLNLDTKYTENGATKFATVMDFPATVRFKINGEWVPMYGSGTWSSDSIFTFPKSGNDGDNWENWRATTSSVDNVSWEGSEWQGETSFPTISINNRMIAIGVGFCSGYLILKKQDFSTLLYYYYNPAMTSCNASVLLQENTTTAKLESLSAPAGTFYAGQNVPITAKFSYPLKVTSDMTITVNGKALTPQNAGTVTDTVTYLYKVGDSSGGSVSVTATAFEGAGRTCTGANTLDVTVTEGTALNKGELSGLRLESIDREKAFDAPQLTVTKDENNKPRLNVTVHLSSNKVYTNWVLSELAGSDNNELTSLQVITNQTGSERFSFVPDNPDTPTALTAAIDLPYNTSTSAIDLAADFFLDNAVWMGKGLTTQVEGSKPIPAEDMTPKLIVTPADGGAGSNYDPDNKPPVLYAEQGSDLTLNIGLTGSNYTWGDTTKVTADPDDTGAHFLWKSSNPAVATVRIDDRGVSLIPTGQAGTTTITLTALNGALTDAESAGIEVEFAVGSDPFLLIPASGRTVAIRQGQDAVVSWTSNICQKNQTGGEAGGFAETVFDVRLSYETGNETVTVEKAGLPPAVQSALTTSAENPVISSVTLPWEGLLGDIYAKNVRSLTVEVSTSYLGKSYGTYTPEDGEKVENATATITMTSRPAAVTLAEPIGGLYQVDRSGGLTLPLTWTVEDLDTTATGQGKFELYITRDGWDGTITETKLAGDGGNVTKNGDQYTYNFQVPEVELTSDPTSYRDSYSITVKAKNAAEATWSSSSYVLYVYSDQALKIMLDGAEAGSDLIMSNQERIANLWGGGGENGSKAIVALQRDIALKNVISANYGEYAWAELADQIAWNSSDSSVATVNYQQGTLYENIEHFSYTSYRPTTDFVLSGLKDGSTTVTARHVKTNLTDDLLVRVETLRDQLYLFQCYPKTETELTYYTWLDKEHIRKSAVSTLKTNANGEAAIYAPYGIAGDVYCKSTTTEDGQTVTWLGTIYNRNLVSSEADSTKLQLYPVNTLQLRRAAQAVIYLKNPDGTPYRGQVTFRGGVYRDGAYCTGDSDGEQVLFGLQNEKRDAWKPGDTDHTASTGANGALTVTMDVSSFKHAGNQTEVEAGDRMYYLFQLEGGTGNEYYPLFFRVDATMNIKDVAASGDSIVTWEENETPEKAKTPYVAMQTLKYNQSAAASVADVRKSTGSVGPSETFPEAWLTTNVIWWGMENAASGRTVTLQDTNGKAPEGQASKIVTYPFTDLAFTEHVMKMDKSTMDSWGIASGDKRAVRLALSEDGTATSRIISLPFHVVNLIGVPKAEEDKSLKDAANEIKDSTSVTGVQMPAGDFLINMGLALVASDAEYDGSTNSCAIRLYATSDPTVFRALFSLSAGNMSSDENATGVYPAYTNTEDMAFAKRSDSDLDLMPTPMNLYKMYKGTYKDSLDDEHKDALDNKGVRGYHFDAGGYFEADITYNTQAKKWECRPVSGGFHAGGGLNYNWYVNLIVGPVPVTVSLTLGGTLEIGMDMQRGTYYQVINDVYPLENAKTEEEFNKALKTTKYTEETGNDYLTKLRIFLYIRAFAGLGIDISILAFKVGVFGQLNVDLNFHFLNRDYLEKKYNISAVGPVDTRKKEYMDGQKMLFSGSTGVEFLFKFLFVSYEKVFCSWGFQLGGTTGEWEEIQEIWAANKKINNQPVQRMMMPNGQVMYAVDLGPQLESRDYVDLVDQEWVGDQPRMSLFGLVDRNDSFDESFVKYLQAGAYSYANPVLSDDGRIMMYLSDRGTSRYADAKDITNTRVAVSVKSGDGKFPQGDRFDNTEAVPVGYGDSNVKLTGKDSHYAAAWVRQMTDITVEGGGALSEGDQRLQMNSTEIVAAISSNGSDWTLTRLTDNSSPDLAPVVATNGTRTIVAWREVSSSDVDSLTSFDQQDAIRYKVYDGSNWSETQTLYDGTGTAASVKGLEMAMLKDGTAAVVYTLDADAGNNSNTDWETVAALIPAEDMSAGQSKGGAETENSEDTVRTFRLTNDSDLDENPQIATAKFGTGDSAVERFVVAWHTERAISETAGQTQSDIRLAAMDKNGALYENMPESLGRATEGTGETVGSNFRLSKNAASINDLSILWADSVAGEISIPQDGVLSGYADTGYDVLKAVRFVEDGSSYTLSGTVEVAEMTQGTLIDHFDAYMDGGKIKSVILGTDYSNTTQRQVTVSDGTTDQFMTMEVANPVTGMYTVEAEFTNQIEMPAIMSEYDKLFPNSDVDVQFTIRNSGKDAVTALHIVSGDDNQTVYYSTTDDPLYNGQTGRLNMLPNRDITVTAKIPTGAAIENVDYVIKAVFGSSGEVQLPGTLYLDIPDVGVSKVETIKEADGERTLRYSLYNGLSAKLADENDGWRVQVGFYTDQTCTELLKDADNQDLIRTIDSKDDLALIDNGGYSSTVTLPVSLYAGEGNEIPTTSIPVYVKAWVEEAEQPVVSRLRAGTEPKYTPITEYNTTNNSTSLLLDNLACRRGEDVTIDAELYNSDTASQVTVNIQYNKLTGTTNGNLIVTLLDASGQPLEKLQSYTEGSGLLTLSKEGTAEQTFTFTQKGADVKVEFSDLVLGENSVELDHVSLTEADVTYDPATKTYTATGAGLTSSILDIAPKDPNAAITLDKVQYDAKGTKVNDLKIGRNEWTITVTNGGNSETYKLVLNNANPESGEVPGVPSEPTDPTVPVTGVSLNKTSLELAAGATEQLTATIAPANATSRGLTWTSNNSSVATVDSSGNVTAVGAGTATITVTTADGGHTATCVVTVKAGTVPTVSVTGVTLNKSSMNLTAGGTDRLTAAIAPSNATNKGLTWTSSNPAVATVDSSGIVTAVSAGTAVITVTTLDGSHTATCSVTVKTTSTNPGTPTNPGNPVTGGGSSGYSVTVTRPEHGKVTASPTNANSGSTVTLTVTPDSGYVLDTLTVTDSRGNEIKLTAQGGGKYTFTMPSRAVTIKATFSPLPGDVTKPCDGGADCPSRAFTDLGGVGTWYHEAVDYALRNNLMGGYGNGLFGPNNNLTRAQLAQILYNREGRPAVSGSSPFTDVANGAWYSDAITWAAANGIVSGYGGGKFGPNDNITREQLATILWRYSKSPAATNKELHFNDADEISGYALDAIRWAVEHGILNGFGDGRLGPKGLATRAQVAQMLKNFIENQEDNI